MTSYDHGWDALMELQGESGYEGYVKYADDSVVSLQCYDGRHGECPQRETDQGDPLNFPLDGYCCECCNHHRTEGA